MSCSASYGQTMPNHYINSALHTMSTTLSLKISSPLKAQYKFCSCFIHVALASQKKIQQSQKDNTQHITSVISRRQTNNNTEQ